jgi:hypothetical protein
VTFAVKFDALMIITRTKNSALAMHIAVDASLISRFRRGERVPSKKGNYLDKIASYFSLRISTDYQKTALCQALKIPVQKFPADQKKTAELIYSWLIDNASDSQVEIADFIDDLSSFQFKKSVQTIDSAPDTEAFENSRNVLYGVKGKQNLVLVFLSLILKSKKPQTLLLFSDEDFSWLADDHEYAAKWAALMFQVIQQGNRIKIIHTVNRSVNEMFVAIREWLPLYLTGAIEPYYYSKIRDGVFKRTLFIAPGSAAIASSSVGTQSENNANFLYTEPSVVSALAEEYNSYLAMCRPLMQFFTPHYKTRLLSTFEEFESEPSDIIIKSDCPSSITMPAELLPGLAMRIEADEEDPLLNYQKRRIEKFEKILGKFSYTEIITMPDVENIRKGRQKIQLFNILSNKEVFYTPDEYVLHLNNIISLLKRYKSYNLYISPENNNQECMLYSKDGIGVIVAKITSPSVVFAMNESHLTAAFWDYLNSIAGELRAIGKSKTIYMLESIVKSL